MNYKDYFKNKLIEEVERYEMDFSQDEPPDLGPRYYPGSYFDSDDDDILRMYGTPGGEMQFVNVLPWPGWPRNLPSPEDYPRLTPEVLWRYIPSWHPMWSQKYTDERGRSVFPNGKPSRPNQIPSHWRWNPNRFGDGHGGWTSEPF
jgi:hypothetical protein